MTTYKLVSLEPHPSFFTARFETQDADAIEFNILEEDILAGIELANSILGIFKNNYLLLDNEGEERAKENTSYPA